MGAASCVAARLAPAGCCQLQAEAPWLGTLPLFRRWRLSRGVLETSKSERQGAELGLAGHTAGGPTIRPDADAARLHDTVQGDNRGADDGCEWCTAPFLKTGMLPCGKGGAIPSRLGLVCLPGRCTELKVTVV